MLEGPKRKQERTRLPRVSRLIRLRAANSRAKKLFTTGLLPSQAYGAEVFGVDDKEVWDLQTKFLQVCGPSSRGRSRSLALGILGDPTWRVATAPLVAWHKEVWHSSLLLPDHAQCSRAFPLGKLTTFWRAVQLQPPALWKG